MEQDCGCGIGPLQADGEGCGVGGLAVLKRRGNSDVKSRNIQGLLKEKGEWKMSHES